MSQSHRDFSTNFNLNLLFSYHVLLYNVRTSFYLPTFFIMCIIFYFFFLLFFYLDISHLKFLLSEIYFAENLNNSNHFDRFLGQLFIEAFYC